MTISLFEDLKRGGWHSSIMTTFSVDPSFYDGSVEYRLRLNGCENNILMADSAMLHRALAATPEAFVNAGRSYMLFEIGIAGCFHPKIHLRLGTNKARLIVGSANVTAAGWGANREIVTAIGWSRDAADGDAAPLGPLIAKSYRYLCHWLSRSPGEALAYKLDLHRLHSPWLPDLEPNQEPIVLADGSAIDLFCEQADGGVGMLEKFGTLIAGETVRRLVIVSPYWDVDLDGLRALQAATSHPPTLVALNARENSFPVDRLRLGHGVTFASLQGVSATRFVHAKLVLAETDEADHLLFGSPNCSDDALGKPNVPARNAEVAVYRRLPPGKTVELLGLDLGDVIDPADITLPEKTSKNDKPPAPPPGGVIEHDSGWLIWWPPDGRDADGAAIISEGAEYPVHRTGVRIWRGGPTTELDFPLVVRIRFASGTVSGPIIVNDTHCLRNAARGPINPKLQLAFARVVSGEADIVDLALNAHLLFAVEPREPTGRSGGGGAKSSDPERSGRDFEDEQSFRDHIERKAATGRSGRFELTDIGLLDLLVLVTRGTQAVIDAAADRARAIAELAALEQGESEDGDDTINGSPPSYTGQGGRRPDRSERRIYSPEDITARRAQLIRAVDKFESMLDALARDPAMVGMRLCAQSVFIFHLILYGCIKPHADSQGASSPLLSLGLPPGPKPDRRNCFAIRTARLVERIWGSEGKPGLVVCLEPRSPAGVMADELFALIVMSRWATGRACLALNAAPKPLPEALRKVALHVYRVSCRFGPIDPEAERTFMVDQDEMLGFDREETTLLLKHHDSLLTALGS